MIPEEAKLRYIDAFSRRIAAGQLLYLVSGVPDGYAPVDEARAENKAKLAQAKADMISAYDALAAYPGGVEWIEDNFAEAAEQAASQGIV